jgi:hypothetical protein
VKFLPLFLTNKTDIRVFFEQVLKLFGFNIKRMEIKTLDFETLEISDEKETDIFLLEAIQQCGGFCPHTGNFF